MPLATRRLPAVGAAVLAAVTLVQPAPTSTPADALVSTPRDTVVAGRVDRREPQARLAERSGTLTFVMESVRTRRRGEVVRFTDHVGRGQRVHCRSITAHVARVSRDSTLVWHGRVRLRVTRCRRDPDPRHRGGTLVQAHARVPHAGQFVVLVGTARARMDLGSRLSHSGAVAQHGHRGWVHASIAAPAPPRPAPSAAVPLPTTAGPAPAAPTTRAAARPSAVPEAAGPPHPAPPAGTPMTRRTATLVGGLLIFLVGATGVTVGLRRRG